MMLLLSGIDPAQERSLRKAGSAKDTFRSIADEYVDKLKKEGRADRTISKVKWLLDFAYRPPLLWIIVRTALLDVTLCVCVIPLIQWSMISAT